jgi:hypothetical protein
MKRNEQKGREREEGKRKGKQEMLEGSEKLRRR